MIANAVSVNPAGASALKKNIADFITDCRAAGRSPRTITWYSRNLRAFTAYCVAHKSD